MNLLNEVNAFVQRALPSLPTICLEVFARDADTEVMARSDPSPAAEIRYLDGARLGTLKFSYYARSLNSETARTTLEAIVDVLDFAELTGISPAVRVKLIAVTTPAFVAKTEAGEVTFVSSFALEYLV